MTINAECGVRNAEFRRSDVKKSGFTLIEVMIALTIFTIGILGISGMLIIGENGITVGNKSHTAVQVSKAQMEQLKGDANIETSSGECTALNSTDVQCQWTIREDSNSADLFEIEVRALWNEGDKKRELVLNTLKYIR